MKRISLLFAFAWVVLAAVACVQNAPPHDDNNNNNDPIVIETSETHYLGDTDDAFTVYRFETNVEGPTFFIIAGIHGNERAGWMAALELLDYDFTRGTVYILPMANRLAIENDPPTRNAPGRADLNRAFPGRADGTELERLANAIFQAIINADPDIVLDLHEARYSYTDSFQHIGDSVVTHHSASFLYLLDVLDTFNALPLMEGKTPFTYFGSPPEGSINRTLTDSFDIPVFTLETNRNSPSYSIASELNPLSERITQQLALIKIFLDTFETPNEIE